MITMKFNQTKSDVITFSYEATINDNPFATVKVGGIDLNATINFNDNTSYLISQLLKEQLKEFVRVFRDYFHEERVMSVQFIKDQDNIEIGKLVLIKKRTSLFNGYYYYKMDTNDEQIHFYHVGFGKKGNYICIYQNNKQIGLIDKSISVEDYLDTYTIYLENEEFSKEVVAFLSAFDMAFYGNVGKKAIKKRENVYYYSLNKEVISKFNKEFANKIRKSK